MCSRVLHSLAALKYKKKYFYLLAVKNKIRTLYNKYACVHGTYRYVCQKELTNAYSITKFFKNKLMWSPSKRRLLSKMTPGIFCTFDRIQSVRISF